MWKFPLILFLKQLKRINQAAGKTHNMNISMLMQALDQFWRLAVDFVWGLPLIIFICAASGYFFLRSRLLPYLGLRHGIDLLRGRYSDPDDPGEIPHFQSLSSALSGTIGMGNVAGVAIAITLGGPGSVFWMWLAALLGMMTKFFTCTLACMYRHEDEDGVVQGGPMYFIEYGLGRRYRPLAVMFALCGLIGCLPMVQANQLAGLLHAEWGIPPTSTGISAAIIVGIVIAGDVKRLGKTAAGFVPLMFLLYVASSMYIVISNYQLVPGILSTIVKSAFGLDPVTGSAAGLTFREILITGVKRAVYSNEAGVGTEALAHGAALTRQPVREGLVAMWGPFIDTHVICTLTALVILISGVGAQDTGVVMAANAFEQFIPAVGKDVLFISISMFAVSTMITYSYYSVKCSRYLFGKRRGSWYLYFYLLFIPCASNWTQAMAVNIIDTMFALMVIPTLSATILLAPRVVEAMREYFARDWDSDRRD